MNGRQDSSAGDSPRRTEPVIGNLAQLESGGSGRSPARPPRRVPAPPPPARRASARWRWWTLALGLLIAAAGTWAFRHQPLLRSWLPQTQLNALLQRADAAYVAGRLSGGADSARELFEAARVLAPDNEQAAAGLTRVGQAELERARSALQRRDYAVARSAVELARSLLGGGDAVAAVDDALAKAVLQNASIDVLIDQARAALAAGRIDGSDGAAALFGKVLAGAPDNAVARHGMEQIGNLLALRIQSQLATQDRAGASQTLAQLVALLPGYAQLPTLQAAVAHAERVAVEQRDQYLAQGAADLAAGQLSGEGSDNAEAQFKAALALDPGSSAARAGLAKLAMSLIAVAQASIDAGQLDAARQTLAHAATLAPGSIELAAASARLASAAPAPATTPASAAAHGSAAAMRLNQLLTRAAAAARQGDIMLPPGDSAYDLYNAALAIDGNDARAQAGLHGLAEVTRGEFKSALQKRELEQAHDLWATLQQLAPDAAQLPLMRQQLGAAWLARADAAVAQGQLPVARTALEQARRLLPQDPRIAELDARLHAGG